VQIGAIDLTGILRKSSKFLTAGFLCYFVTSMTYSIVTAVLENSPIDVISTIGELPAYSLVSPIVSCCMGMLAYSVCLDMFGIKALRKFVALFFNRG